MASITGDLLFLNPWRSFSYLDQNGAFPWTQTKTKEHKQKHKFTLSSKTTRKGVVLALPFDLSPPPIDHDLLGIAATEGAKVSDDGIVETFDNDDQAFDAADNGVVVADLSHFGRIRVSGEDRIQFLHNQTTANFECLHEGQGCDTVFVTPTARTIDIAHAWIMKNAVLLVVSPVTSRSISEMLNKHGNLNNQTEMNIWHDCGARQLFREFLTCPIQHGYIFFNDNVEIQDITKQTCFFVLVGPKSNQIMEELNLGDLVGQPYGTHQHFSVNGMPITVGVGNVISEKGFSLLMSPAAAGSVWKTILSQGAIPMGSNAWEKLRIFHGRPAPQKELTNEYNVLEAGLWNSISLNKGCYKGQETIARLITYDGVKQRLWAIRLSAPAEVGSLITIDGKKVGKLTSCTSGRKENGYFGLGYIKRQTVSEGDTVIVGDAVPGTVVEVPFLAGQRSPTRSSSS